MISGLSDGLAHGIYLGTDKGLFMGQYGNRSSFYKETIRFIAIVPLSDTQQIALNFLVKSLVDFGLWNKMHYIYPFIGGTAFSHKFNLKDPRDSNAAFRLSFSVGWTHSSTGAFNAASGFANTFYAEASNLVLGSGHFSIQTRNSFAADTAAMGAVTTSIAPTAATGLLPVSSASPGGNKFIISLQRNTAGADFSTIASPGGRGAMWIGSRTDTSFTGFYLNGVQTDVIARAASNLNTRSHYIGSRNFDGVSNLPAANEFIFASAGTGLTEEDVANLFYVVNQYQIALGRQP